VYIYYTSICGNNIPHLQNNQGFLWKTLIFIKSGIIINQNPNSVRLGRCKVLILGKFYFKIAPNPVFNQTNPPSTRSVSAKFATIGQFHRIVL